MMLNALGPVRASYPRPVSSASSPQPTETSARSSDEVSLSANPRASLPVRCLRFLGKTVAVMALAGALVGLGTLVPHDVPVGQPQVTRPALQKHVDFFDRNGDGQTQVWETYGGMRAMGFDRATSALAAPVINGALGLKSGSPWYQPLTVQNRGIHLTKHEGDTDIYDAQGNFVQAKFDQMFEKHDQDKDDALNESEIASMLKINGDGEPNAGSKAEFSLLLRIAGEDRPEGRVLTRQTMEQFYDGSLFYHLAGEKPPA